MSKKTFKYGKNTRPSWVQIKERDGRTDVLHGNDKQANHGHVVQKDGKTVFARTPEGRVLIDDSKAEAELRKKLEKFISRNDDKDISGR